MFLLRLTEDVVRVEGGAGPQAPSKFTKGKDTREHVLRVLRPRPSTSACPFHLNFISKKVVTRLTLLPGPLGNAFSKCGAAAGPAGTLTEKTACSDGRPAASANCPEPPPPQEWAAVTRPRGLVSLLCPSVRVTVSFQFGDRSVDSESPTGLLFLSVLCRGNCTFPGGCKDLYREVLPFASPPQSR